MTEHGNNATQPSHGLVKEPELTHDCSAVIVNALARQLVIRVEPIDAAKRELHTAACRWQAAPRTEMRAADDHLQHHTLGSDVPMLHLNYQIGQRAYELGVI